MLTNEQAEYLMGLEKNLVNPSQIIDLSKQKNRLDIISYEDRDCKFMVELTSNHKILFKTSVHHMESISYVGLLRIDFGGQHKNPEEIKAGLPEKLKKYAGLWMEPFEPHMHIYVEGYKPLAWAIPLKDTDFPTKKVKSQADINELMFNFARRINLSSKLNIQGAIL